MAYGLAREWGMRPDDFWALSLTEFWWELDFRAAAQQKLKKPASGNKFSDEDWAAARRLHAEKMKYGTSTASR